MMKKSKCVGIVWKKFKTLATSVAFAERITAHKTLRNSGDLSGVFLFLLVDAMADKVQAKKDLEFCSAELSKYQNLSRSGLTRDEMLAIDGIMIKLKKRIKNLKLGLYD